MKKISILDFYQWKKDNKKFASLTAYDASFSHLFEQCNIPFLLVGDSLGMVIHGKNDTTGVTMEDIIYHTKAVRRGAPNTFITADLPFLSYTNVTQACENSRLAIQAGANMVKLEGGMEIELIVQKLTEQGVPVCAHIGLLPQNIHLLGEYKVKGKSEAQAQALLSCAQQMENAGASMLLLECVSSALAKKITKTLTIPVIGIGAGIDTDGQILVMHDILGLYSNYIPKFAKNYMIEHHAIDQAIIAYRQEVENGQFPQEQHSFK